MVSFRIGFDGSPGFDGLVENETSLPPGPKHNFGEVPQSNEQPSRSLVRTINQRIGCTQHAKCFLKKTSLVRSRVHTLEEIFYLRQRSPFVSKILEHNLHHQVFKARTFLFASHTNLATS